MDGAADAVIDQQLWRSGWGWCWKICRQTIGVLNVFLVCSKVCSISSICLVKWYQGPSLVID